MDIENTYCEAFEGFLCRLLVTAKDKKRLEAAARNSTTTPAMVIGRPEAGIEKYVSGDETPDGRLGAILEFWGNATMPLEEFYKELSYRIRQDILCVPTTALYDALDPNEWDGKIKIEGQIDTMPRVGYCGDGFEWEEEYNGRNVIVVPLMCPDFRIERYFNYALTVCGGNFWYYCETEDAMLEGGDLAVDAISMIDGAITSFDICPGGSKSGSVAIKNLEEIKSEQVRDCLLGHRSEEILNTHTEPINKEIVARKELGPPTNHLYCPSLKEQLGAESKVPKGVKYIPEIVIDGVTLDIVKKAMAAGIDAVINIPGVVGISFGNYGGNLGKYMIPTTDIVPLLKSDSSEYRVVEPGTGRLTP